jgi:hypothetical protein
MLLLPVCEDPSLCDAASSLQDADERLETVARGSIDSHELDPRSLTRPGGRNGSLLSESRML